MGKVEFKDNIAVVQGLLKETAIQFLNEVGGELTAQVQRNTKVDTGQLKGSWTYIVDEANLKVIVGSPLQNAIWEEFGTGEYAKDGRNTAWFVPEDAIKGGKSKPTYNGKVEIVYGKNGKKFYKTNGKRPKRTLQTAYDKTKPKIERRLESLMKGN